MILQNTQKSLNKNLQLHEMLRQKITPTQQNRPLEKPVVVQQWYYKFDPNAETLYASVHTTTTTTDTRSNNANTSTRNNICEESVYYDDFDPRE